MVVFVASSTNNIEDAHRIVVVVAAKKHARRKTDCTSRLKNEEYRHNGLKEICPTDVA